MLSQIFLPVGSSKTKSYQRIHTKGRMVYNFSSWKAKSSSHINHGVSTSTCGTHVQKTQNDRVKTKKVSQKTSIVIVEISRRVITNKRTSLFSATSCCYVGRRLNILFYKYQDLKIFEGGELLKCAYFCHCRKIKKLEEKSQQQQDM